MASHVVHTQVLKFFGSFADPRGETVSLVIEFMDAGSLDQFMGADALSCPKFLQRAAVGALRGLGHLHAHRVVHRA
jgi:serine/threonine protein kinase